MAWQATLPGMESAEDALWMRELQQEAAPSYEVAARRAQLTSALAGVKRAGADPAWLYQLSAAMARGTPPPSSLRLRQAPAFTEPAAILGIPASVPPLAAAQVQPVTSARRPSAREELAGLSQVLSYSKRYWQPYRGAFRQPSPSEGTPQLLFPDALAEAEHGWERRANRAETVAWAARDLALMMKAKLESISLQQTRRRVAGIEHRQRVLLRALRRALSRLGFADAASLNADPRGRVIGQVFRARFTVAVFGGETGREQLGGLFCRGKV